MYFEHVLMLDAIWPFLTALYHETCNHVLAPIAPLHNMMPSATVTKTLYMMEKPIRNDNPRPRRRSIHTAILSTGTARRALWSILRMGQRTGPRFVGMMRRF